MAHADQLDFIKRSKQHLPTYFKNTHVLEIGSLDINGSVRSMFDTQDYIGVDVGEGPGVDHVCQGQLVDYPTESFDTVISCECMEHNPFWVETISNMLRMAKPGGLVILSFATTGRAEHGTTRTSSADSPLSIGIGWEYYHNISAREFMRAVNLDAWLTDYLVVTNWHNSDLYFVGIKKGGKMTDNLGSLRQSLQKRFGPLHSFRSMSVMVAARLFGEAGPGMLRSGWRGISHLRGGKGS